MTRQTRIGLLVGLAFIILFGLVLGELTGTADPAPAPEATEDAASYAHARRIEEIYLPEEPISIAVPWATDAGATEAENIGETVLAAGPSETPSSPVREASGRATGRADSLPESARQVPTHSVTAGARTVRTYTVRPNDSLIRIARVVYGANRWREYKRIYRANRDKLQDESTVQVGMVLVIPPLEDAASAGGPGTVAAAGAPAPNRPTARSELPATGEMTLAEMARHFGVSRSGPTNAGRVYVVRHGDNLTRIARITLNDGSRTAVLRLYNANRDRLSSPDHLPVGLALRIPSNG